LNSKTKDFQELTDTHIKDFLPKLSSLTDRDKKKQIKAKAIEFSEIFKNADMSEILQSLKIANEINTNKKNTSVQLLNYWNKRYGVLSQ
jgi:hypothetical protein